jgi:hypothetical protein
MNQLVKCLPFLFPAEKEPCLPKGGPLPTYAQLTSRVDRVSQQARHKGCSCNFQPPFHRLSLVGGFLKVEAIMMFAI